MGLKSKVFFCCLFIRWLKPTAILQSVLRLNENKNINSIVPTNQYIGHLSQRYRRLKPSTTSFLEWTKYDSNSVDKYGSANRKEITNNVIVRLESVILRFLEIMLRSTIIISNRIIKSKYVNKSVII
ncbi:MAG: hypothetical protein WC121_08650 [Candidatus Kapaibacterium sp.]